MNVSRHRRSYHGNFVGPPCQVPLSPQALPMMAFQSPHPPPPSSAITPTATSASPLSNHAPPYMLVDNNNDGEDEARQYVGMVDMMRDCNGMAYSESTFDPNQNDEQQQQVGGQVGDGASSYIDGRFRAYGLQQSWHQPVVDETQAHLFHHQHHHLQRQQPSPSSSFGAPSQMSSSGSAYGSYDNRLSAMMATHDGPMHPPPPQPVPFYNQMGAPSANNSNSNYFMGSQLLGPPSTSSLRLRPPPHMNHFDAMAELNDRRAYAMTAASTIPSASSPSSGSHLSSIMASNMNPPDHLLHIYPSNLSNR